MPRDCRGGVQCPATVVAVCCAPRLSWRDNVVDEDYEVPQHEHSYERAVKMAPREMASVAARVEYLLALHPPEVMAAGVEAPDFGGDAIRLNVPAAAAARGVPSS